MRRECSPLVLLFLAFSLGSCSSLPPIENEIPLASSDLSIKAASDADTKVVIFNTSSSLMFGVDGSGRINVRVDGKGLTQLNIGQYAQLFLPKGAHEVELTHRDITDFDSTHQLQLTESDSFVEIYATVTSNELKLVPALAPDFIEKYKPVN